MNLARTCRPALLAGFLALASALPSAAQPSTADLGVQFALRLGDEAVINEAGLHILFDNVLEDSRCPEDTECFWQGLLRLSLRVELTDGNGTETFDVELDTMNQVGTVDGYHFTLTEVGPRAQLDMGPDPAYVGWFIVTAAAD